MDRRNRIFGDFAASGPVRAAVLAVAFTLAVTLVFASAPVRAASVSVSVDLDQGTLLVGERQTAWLRVGLTGEAAEGRPYRAPLNIALVIDCSGSMAGSKIQQAKRAALAALDRMGPDDIVSVVAYDTTVSVLVPATKVSDRRSIERGIKRLRADGNTALFAGTVKGAREVRKFMSRERVNRVVLMSDGLANVGPDSPAELAELGRALREEGIGVSTVGIGADYNEDLMVALASASGAPFVFVENARDLDRLYDKGLGTLQSIVATGVSVTIRFTEGFRPTRCLGRDGEIVGQTVVIPLAQLYGSQTEELLVGFETSGFPPSSQAVASVDVRYHWLPTDEEKRAEGAASVEFSTDPVAVAESANATVKVVVIQRLSDERALAAMALRDEGRIEAARRALDEAQRDVDAAARRYKSERLRKQKEALEQDESNLRDPNRWKRQRKSMQRRSQHLFSDEML